MLKIHSNGQWELIKSRPMSDEEMKAFKERRDAHLRAKHGMPSKEEHEKQLAATRGREVPKSTKPDYGKDADKRYKESYHSATREVSPGKFVHQGMPKAPPKDMALPVTKRPEFHGGGFERSPVRMGNAVRKK